MVKPRDHESTVRVLVSTLNTGVTTIEAAEEVAEMVLVPTLMPFLEELGKIYWTLVNINIYKYLQKEIYLFIRILYSLNYVIR